MRPFDPQKHLNLFVKDRIKKADSDRQHASACEVLKRLDSQPGIVLADEVGMGKTFVALSVAAAAHFNDPERRPVVIMVPSALAGKWPSDAEVFRDCLSEPFKSEFRFPGHPITSGIDFLKTLDDIDMKKRNSVVFITHTALHRSLQDNWVRLAILRRALFGRHDVDDIRKALARFAGDLLMMKWKVDEDAWEGLLARDPSDWLGYLKRNFKDSVPEDDDDPVPSHLWAALDGKEFKPKLNELFETLTWIPRRESKKLHENIVEVRRRMKEQINEIWGLLKGRLSIRLPMLVFDEAHHLKNTETQLVKSLFQNAGEDAQEVKGAFAGVFEKILFLTATPFQLGHHELLNVLGHFESVAWEKQGPNSMDRETFKRAMKELELGLDDAQTQALSLDQAWGRLTGTELKVGDKVYVNVEDWWLASKTNPEALIECSKSAYEQALATKMSMKKTEELLRPWVLRNLKDKSFVKNNEIVFRRNLLPGKAIQDESKKGEGLSVEGKSALPFLLAARTVSVQPQGRAVFAEGLASSYEAFLHTHSHRIPGGDQDEVSAEMNDDPQMQWYANAIKESLEKVEGDEILSGHPKIEATVNRVLNLWEQGEKVVVFCHYIETGRALRGAISSRIRKAIYEGAAEKMKKSIAEAEARLESLGEEFFDKENDVREAFNVKAKAILQEHGTKLTAEESDNVLDIMRRYFRTPAFLARYFPLKNDPVPEDVEAAFETKDQSGMTLREVFTEFVVFIANRCRPKEREGYLEALGKLKTGSFRQGNVQLLDGEEEVKLELLLPNVRLVNGATAPQARRMLMLAFNSPFYPEILVASAVLAEGVDLHLNCRNIIHHDLSWNPSTLEQRNGRVDRIGAKVEKCGKSIDVFLPYVSGTQDEKMYRVVMDRERWFKVVMGEEFKPDIATTERIAERVPLPEGLVKELAFELGVRPA